MRVCVCVPSGDYICSEFMASMFAMFSSERETQLVYVNTRSSLVQEARFLLVRTALGTGADKFLFIDSDHIFPPDALSRLLKHDKDMVGATYVRRRPEYSILGRTLDGYLF